MMRLDVQTAPFTRPISTEHVVELGILLPAKRANDLVELARRRRLTVGQILRGLIEQELTLEAADLPQY